MIYFQPASKIDSPATSIQLKLTLIRKRTHFVEYLVSIVAKANIDPLPILDLTDCVQELRRRGLQLPERGPWDTDPIYRDMCSKVNTHRFYFKFPVHSCASVRRWLHTNNSYEV